MIYHRFLLMRASYAILLFFVLFTIFSTVSTLFAMEGDVCFATADNGTTVFSSADATAVQDAVDVAPVGGTVKLSGDCVGTQTRATLTQSVYISQTITLDGSYDASDWFTSLPTQTAVVDAAETGRVIYITEGVTVTLNQLVIRNGSIANKDGGGIYADGSNGMPTILNLSYVTIENNQTTDYFGNGGGIYAKANQLNMSHVILRNNISADSGGGLYLSPPSSALNVTNSAIYSNTADSFGGGLTSAGIFNLSNTTISHNHADYGGGFYSTNGVFVSNSSIVSNTASIQGGGIRAGSYSYIKNSILAYNRLNGVIQNCSGNSVTSNGQNIADDACSGLSGASNDMINTDPELRPLKTTNGVLPYHYPRATSPALDAGEAPACTVMISPFTTSPFYTDGEALTTDQRGTIRLDADEDTVAQCDVGAIEYLGEEAPICEFAADLEIEADIATHNDDLIIIVHNLDSFVLNRTDAPFDGNLEESVITSHRYTHTNAMVSNTNHYYEAGPSCEAAVGGENRSVQFGKFSFGLEPGN